MTVEYDRVISCGLWKFASNSSCPSPVSSPYRSECKGEHYMRTDKKGITVGFIIGLLAYLVLEGIADLFMEPPSEPSQMAQLGILGSFIGLILSLLLLFFGSLLFWLFWNSFVRDIFSLRYITFYEALATGLFFGVVVF